MHFVDRIEPMLITMKSYFLFVALLFGLTCTYSQTFVSPQQETTEGGFSDAVETLLTKKVIIEGEDYSIELPWGGVLAGRLELMTEIHRDTENRILYELSNGGVLGVIDDVDDKYDHVFVNLLGTDHKKTITYWLVKADRGDD